jgi:hypothetical protein
MGFIRNDGIKLDIDLLISFKMLIAEGWLANNPVKPITLCFVIFSKAPPSTCKTFRRPKRRNYSSTSN